GVGAGQPARRLDSPVAVPGGGLDRAGLLLPPGHGHGAAAGRAHADLPAPDPAPADRIGQGPVARPAGPAVEPEGPARRAGRGGADRARAGAVAPVDPVPARRA